MMARVTRRRLAALAIAMAVHAQAASACGELAAGRALPPAAGGQWSLVTQNLWRLRDSHDSGGADSAVSEAQLQARLRALAAYVRDHLTLPHVLAVQEVETLELLQQLAEQVARISGARYRAYLLEGADPAGMDVGVLVREPVQVHAVEQLFTDLEFDGAALFTRPPLLVTLSAPQRLSLLVVHLRSARGLDDADRGAWVRAKRARQARVLRQWMEGMQGPVVLVGDLNSAPGDGAFAESLDLIDDAWPVSAWQHLPPAEQYSYLYRCRPQAIDHVLLPVGLAGAIGSVAVSRGNAGRYRALNRSAGVQPVSDHDALAVYFQWRTEQGKQ